jgi:hypothetical protein
MNLKDQVRRIRRLSLTLPYGVFALGVASLATPAAAQTADVPTDEIPAHISVVSGTASLERDGYVERAEHSLILLAGDRLSTERGRVEILFADGSAVALDEYSSIDLLDDALMRLWQGRVRVSIGRATGGVEYRVDTVAGSAFLLTPGDYRLDVSGANARSAEFGLQTIRGSAELANELGRTLVRAGSRAVTRADAAPSLPYAVNSAAWDEFDRWADAQQDARLGYESNRYLPDELRYDAGVFDRHGQWAYEPAYGGYAWYPVVDAGWRPYSQGRWSYVGSFGWSWVGAERWSWSTHHYGRWGVTAGRWYWVPDRRWGPAWVSWASAPGYVGWCPLGFNGYPVYSVTSISIRYGDPYYGWTVLPRPAFRHNVVVSQHAVSSRTAVPRVWSEFAHQQTAPHDGALRASAAPLRSPSAAGRAAVSRAGAGRPAASGSAARGASATTPRTTPGAARLGSPRATPSAASQTATPVRRATTAGTTVRGTTARGSAAATVATTPTSRGQVSAGTRRAAPARVVTAPPLPRTIVGYSRSETDSRRASPTSRPPSTSSRGAAVSRGSTISNGSTGSSRSSSRSVAGRDSGPGTISRPAASAPASRAPSSGSRRVATPVGRGGGTTSAPPARVQPSGGGSPPSSGSSGASRRGGRGGGVSPPPAPPASSSSSTSSTPTRRAAGRRGGGGGL